jgi:hypothetical protein
MLCTLGLCSAPVGVTGAVATSWLGVGAWGVRPLGSAGVTRRSALEYAGP